MGGPSPKLSLLDVFFRRANQKIVNEDRAVVESSSLSEVPPVADERSVETDRAKLQFRRYYHHTLRQPEAQSDSAHQLH